MKKSILIFVKNNDALNNYIRMLKNGHFDNEIPYSLEVKQMIKEFSSNNYELFLCTMFNLNIEQGIFYDVFQISQKEKINMTISEVNSRIDIMIIRNLGSVEANFKMIQKGLKFLLENYKGKTINNIEAMLKGMTKNYLTELEPEKMKQIGMETIPSRIFPNTVSFDEICEAYPENRENYLIKPVTGELSNSLKCLAEVDEEFLRWKENKVGGWVIQPIQKEIWKGEFQISFLNGNLLYSQRKEYPKDGIIPNQKNRKVLKYSPTEMEVERLKKLIDYFSHLYNIPILLCRIDYMKNKDGVPKLLEFEMVNPGVVVRYMNENEDETELEGVIRSIRKYCDTI